jgi:hypothetical protein
MALRLLAGLLLSSLAVAVYSLSREGADAPWLLLTRIWRFEHISDRVTWPGSGASTSVSI